MYRCTGVRGDLGRGIYRCTVDRDDNGEEYIVAQALVTGVGVGVRGIGAYQYAIVVTE